LQLRPGPHPRAACLVRNKSKSSTAVSASLADVSPCNCNAPCVHCKHYHPHEDNAQQPSAALISTHAVETCCSRACSRSCVCRAACSTAGTHPAASPRAACWRGCCCWYCCHTRKASAGPGNTLLGSLVSVKVHAAALNAHPLRLHNMHTCPVVLQGLTTTLKQSCKAQKPPNQRCTTRDNCMQRLEYENNCCCVLRA
jgi:hypothetical protein